MGEAKRERQGEFLGSLNQAFNELEQTIQTSGTLKNIENLPPTFNFIVKHLSVLKDVVISMRDRIGDGNAYQTSHEKYKAIYKLSKTCQDQSKYLRELIDAVATTSTPTTSDTNSPANLDNYHKVVVERGRGFKVDDVLKGLLKKTVEVTSGTQLIDDNLRETLQNALQEITSQGVPSSEQPNAGVSLNNYGAGSQFCHNGTGNQNRCDGGIQITGNGTTNFGQNFQGQK
ncbi:hypothetical protein HDV62DRAFT_358460 [Trichoderma sp. SZMC 28011]